MYPCFLIQRTSLSRSSMLESGWCLRGLVGLPVVIQKVTFRLSRAASRDEIPGGRPPDQIDFGGLVASHMID